eukprot:254727-Chlamydomonas_euryale.AAC.6
MLRWSLTLSIGWLGLLEASASGYAAMRYAAMHCAAMHGAAMHGAAMRGAAMRGAAMCVPATHGTPHCCHSTMLPRQCGGGRFLTTPPTSWTAPGPLFAIWTIAA